MTEIRKKTWPDIFQRVLEGKKNVEVRLADFEIKEGDVLYLRNTILRQKNTQAEA
ncbi:MAG: DUF3850 domain-containing protein [Nanoarchaeota archaeon]|nr:DUF3850 domain-containing protein [Nanoarchaeota archaeon]